MKILKPGKEESTTKTTGTKTSTAYTENKPLTNKELLDDFSGKYLFTHPYVYAD